MIKQRMKGFNLLTLAQYNNLPEQDKKQYFNLVRGLDVYASKADLQNYYTKSEIDQIISIGLKIEVVAELPTEDIRTDTIYLVSKSGGVSDNYDEYIYLENTQSWEHIGSTDVDLTNYYTKGQTDSKLDDLEAETLTLLNAKVDKVDGKGLSTNDYTSTEKNKLAGIEAEANKYILPADVVRKVDLTDYATIDYVDNLIGDIDLILDNINGEVI